ncbi:MAG: hypothetical protein M1826_001199 [Phylliscum demangeonii]|nr:MAG: hypothetical protein M1826_001199 [Phylliscum demangeonii]
MRANVFLLSLAASGLSAWATALRPLPTHDGALSSAPLDTHARSARLARRTEEGGGGGGGGGGGVGGGEGGRSGPETYADRIARILRTRREAERLAARTPPVHVYVPPITTPGQDDPPTVNQPKTDEDEMRQLKAEFAQITDPDEVHLFWSCRGLLVQPRNVLTVIGMKICLDFAKGQHPGLRDINDILNVYFLSMSDGHYVRVPPVPDPEPQQQRIPRRRSPSSRRPPPRFDHPPDYLSFQLRNVAQRATASASVLHRLRPFFLRHPLFAPHRRAPVPARGLLAEWESRGLAAGGL